MSEIEIYEEKCSKGCHLPSDLMYQCPKQDNNCRLNFIKKDQMPETFQELLFLLEDRLQKMNVMLFDNKETTRIKNEFWIKGIMFSRDNTLSIKYNDNIIPFMWNVSYPLMWEIIKSLMGIK